MQNQKITRVLPTTGAQEMVKKCSKESKQKVLKRPCGSGGTPKPERPLGNRARWCETCGQVRKDGPRHRFDHPTHVMRSLTSEERKQFPETENTGDAGEYVFDFGKFKKKSISWVQKHHPSYFAWLVRERVYDKRPNLQEALLKNGLFPATLLEEADSKLRDEQAKRIVDSWDETEEFAVVGPVVPPSAGDSPDIADGSKGKGKRKELTPKQRAKQVAHLKYMAPQQREEDYKLKPKRAALLDRAHSTMDLMRMSPLDFTQTMVAYGLFEDLEGQACRKGTSCQFRGWNQESQLGKLCASDIGKQSGQPFGVNAVYYRCRRCRDRSSVVTRNIYFPSCGGGSYGPEQLVHK